jgi:hypothetical protein
VKRVVRDVGDKFSGIQEVMQRLFLPSLLKVTMSDDDPLTILACPTVNNAPPPSISN